MNNPRISAFLLERYHLGEVTGEEKILMEEAMKNDKKLADELAGLVRSDNDFYTRVSREDIFPREKLQRAEFNNSLQLRKRAKPLAFVISAAALLLIAFIPLFLFNNSGKTEITERMKGAGLADEDSINISIYMKENITGDIIKLADQNSINEGNTIQIVYSVPADSRSEKYGMIFSIDGRSAVTMHYPYTLRQSTLLDRGRAVPLDEAFTLDDAPDYEIFFFVASNAPVNVQNILTSAKRLAAEIYGNPDEASKLGKTAFNEYEVETFTLLKNQ